ncbi:hypothetical protein NDA16_002701 [Ustilago loliicola]|nr:hypothetical protein NDA16_002701 [Ustilago loliicola]
MKPLTAAATTKQGRREQGSSSRDEDSEAGGTASHGSSDKENVPPPAARRAATAANRQSARTRAGVLRAVEDEQPTHSTPISQKRKALRDHDDDDHAQSAGPNLDDLFLADSDRSSQVPSPGVARRAEPMTASAKQLQDYQERGVSKVIAWKAAEHHRAERRARNDGDSEDVSNADSWPDEDESATFDAGAKPRMERSDDDDDEYGFLRAEAKVRDRSTQVLAEPFSFDDERSQARSEQADSDIYVGLPTDPFNTSDDRRLAEQAFAHMSSPPPRHDDSSSTAPLGDVVPLGKHKLHAAPQEAAETDVEDEAESLPHSEKEEDDDEADTSERRVTRSRTKRKSEIAKRAATDDERTPMSTPPPATRKRSERAAKAKKAASGIPLKRTEKKEQEMLSMLAAQDSSSPAHSSAPPSPRASRTSKKAAASPAAKKLRMDDILTLLPSRKRKIVDTKTPASINKRKGSSATARTSKATKASTKDASTPKAKAASKGNGRKRKDSTPEDGIVVDDESDEAPRSRAAKRSARARSTSKKGKKRAVSDDEDEEKDENNWRNTVGSSPIHSDDSERTKRLKEFRAAEKYNMEVEVVL